MQPTSLILILLAIITLLLGWAMPQLVHHENKISSLRTLNDYKQLPALLLITKNRHESLVALITAVITTVTTISLANVMFGSATVVDATHIFIFLVLVASVDLLIYCSVYDIQQLAIPDRPTLSLLVMLALANLLLVFLIGHTVSVQFADGEYLAWNHLLGGGIFMAAIALIVLVTKGKGMGEGDIRMAAIMGMLVGSERLIVTFYIMIFSATIYGIFLAIRKGRFKGVKLPFVPFMALATIIALIFGTQLNSFFLKILTLGN